jgi:hypothetical protein
MTTEVLMPRRKPAAGPQEPQGPPNVTVTNTYRNQPLLFHVRGGSIRLGPSETREISRELLFSPELSHFVGTGAIEVREIELEDDGDAPADAEPAARDGERTSPGQGGAPPVRNAPSGSS